MPNYESAHHQKDRSSLANLMAGHHTSLRPAAPIQDPVEVSPWRGMGPSAVGKTRPRLANCQQIGLQDEN